MSWNSLSVLKFVQFVLKFWKSDSVALKQVTCSSIWLLTSSHNICTLPMYLTYFHCLSVNFCVSFQSGRLYLEAVCKRVIEQYAGLERYFLSNLRKTGMIPSSESRYTRIKQCLKDKTTLAYVATWCQMHSVSARCEYSRSTDRTTSTTPWKTHVDRNRFRFQQ